MKKILIADSGSTKTNWGLINGSTPRMITTQGISPYFLNTEQIRELLSQELLPNIPDAAAINEIYYYGTGCTAKGTIDIVGRALSGLFPTARVHVTYDLVAAAHALCGNASGIACILGTGSNSCYWDGTAVAKNNPGLGYILGDEGSGAYLGKMLIAEYLYGKLDHDIEQEFEQRFEVNKDTLLAKVYSTTLANRFLASFSVFFSEHRRHPDVERLLWKGFDDFFKIHILSYPQSQSLPIHFTGSVAWAYRDVLVELCEEYALKMGKVIKEPMNGLIDYYRRSVLV